MARMLTPAGFAELAAFLALYLLIAVPSLSLAAGGALDPERARRRRGKVLVASIPVSLALAALAAALAPSLGLSVPSALALATTPTLVALIELDRGRLYGERAYGWVTGSLVAEPIVRLVVGVTLAASLGVAGGAIGVVAGGFAGLAVARAGRGVDRGRPRAVPFGREATERNSGTEATDRRGPAGHLAALTFLLLAVVQCQDIVFANASLSGVEAARFAAISTLGGAAVFATATVPFVLMPRAKAGEPGALGAALGTAALLGGGAALVTLIAAEPILTLVYGGGRFDAVASFLPAYMLAMALLGVARVLAADAVARGAKRVPWVALGAGVLQLALLFAIGDSAEGVGVSTLIAAAALTAGLVVERAPELERPINFALKPHLPPAPVKRRRQTALILVAMMVLAIGLRLLASRSLWLDEATSWYETQLPFHRMLEVLRDTDVHPPGYFAVLWATVRGFGDGELALRLP
jgi:hypothetical protein